jgi:hypothetical protein
MKSEKMIRKQLEDATLELQEIERGKKGSWRRTKGYVDALSWVLGYE